jgi:hypothetical protein
MYLQRQARGSTFLATVKPVFYFNRIVAKRSVFLCFLTFPDFDTKENATVRYDTVEVENRLNSYNQDQKLLRQPHKCPPHPQIQCCVND